MDKEEDENFWVINRRLEVQRREMLFLKIFGESFGRDWGIWDIVMMRSFEVLEEFENSWKNIHSLFVHHCSILWGSRARRAKRLGGWLLGLGS